MNGNANALAWNASGNGNGSTMAQKRKLGMSAGGGDASGSGSKARRKDDGGQERRREGDRGKGEIEEGDEIRRRCGSNADDGFSIACDVRGWWCHAACFAIPKESVKESVPEEWACWMSAPQNHIDTFPTNGHASTSNRRPRASISGRPRGTTIEASPPLPNGGAPVDELEDERTQYVLTDDDIVPHSATQRKLRAYAAQSRGVSALEPTPPLLQ
ncbi:hypothetical protein B0H10DRAFT_1031731 [Mycena sp. CBHHK59/15]|nr:hypothetical protein B0H10DRAFT_1031731 [Mycena sp. CBHHK59/15]